MRNTVGPLADPPSGTGADTGYLRGSIRLGVG
jgi:hypothetical protein